MTINNPLLSTSSFALQQKIEPTVIVPIESGFHENSVIYCISYLRERGTRVWLVSSKNCTVRSRHGLTVQVDKRIRELGQPHHATQILLTGGEYSLQSVLNSADMRTLLAQGNKLGNRISATEDVQAVVEESGLMTSLQQLTWRVQNGESLPDFINQVGVM